MTGQATTISRGLFITLEGIEGVGKSTNLEFVADCIRHSGRRVVVTREPGGVPVAERIRELILASDLGAVPSWTELLLIFAARAAHLADLILPALERGEWVVCDRFTDATYAYQGAGRGLPQTAIRTLEKMVQGDLEPDLTVLMDAGWEITRKRRHHRGVDDRFEQEDRQFFERVREGYLHRASEQKERFRVVDAGRNLADVQQELRGIIGELIFKNDVIR